MKTHTAVAQLKLKDEDLEGWTVFFETESSHRLETRRRVADIAGWNIQAYPNDHPPPHIHCKKDGAEVIFAFEGKDIICKERRGKTKDNELSRLRRGIKRQKEKIFRTYRNVLQLRND